MDYPKVSIGITTHHEPIDVLKKCIDSVVAQTYRNIEIVLINDTSIYPGIDELVSSYKENGVGITYFKAPFNVKFAKAKNLSMIYATGKYFIPTDADQEFVDRFFVENGVEFMEGHQDCYIYCGMMINDYEVCINYHKGYSLFYYINGNKDIQYHGGIGYSIYPLSMFSDYAIFREYEDCADDKFFMEIGYKGRLAGMFGLKPTDTPRYTIINSTKTNKRSNVATGSMDDNYYVNQLSLFAGHLVNNKINEVFKK